MSFTKALYYRTIDIPEDNWLTSAILYWDNCFYIDNHLVHFPIDFYEVIIKGECKLMELDYKIISGK